MNGQKAILLKKREADKSELEEKVLSNIRELVMPYIEKMKTKKMDTDQKTFIGVIESNLNDIISAFLPRQPRKYLALTPAEIQISNLRSYLLSLR